MMFPWMAVGLHAPSSSSPATCAQWVEECQRPAVTKLGQMILGTTWFSSAHLRSSSCPSLDQWKMVGWLSYTNHSDTVSLRGQGREHGGQNPPDSLLSGWQCNSNYPSQVQQEQQCVSRPDVQTQQRRMESEAATSMRLTLGCGSLDVVSLALAA